MMQDNRDEYSVSEFTTSQGVVRLSVSYDPTILCFTSGKGVQDLVKAIASANRASKGITQPEADIEAEIRADLMTAKDTTTNLYKKILEKYLPQDGRFPSVIHAITINGVVDVDVASIKKDVTPHDDVIHVHSSFLPDGPQRVPAPEYIVTATDLSEEHGGGAD